MKSTSNQTGKQPGFLRIWVAGLIFASSFAVDAAIIEIDFTAVVNGTGVSNETLTGQFVLDGSVPFMVGDSLAPDIVVGASFDSASQSGISNPNSPFNLASAFRTADHDLISLVSDFGPQLFFLELTGVGLFGGSTDVYSALNAMLTLDELLPFDPSRREATAFTYATPKGVAIQGRLTSLSIRQVPEPAPIALLSLAVLVLRLRRRAAA